MKKLNEDIIRKLIVETLEEVSLGEARKKKVEEAEEGPLENPEQDVAHGMNNPDFDMSDTEVAAMMPSFSDQQIKQAHEALDKAFDLARAANKNPMLKGSAEDMLKGIMNLFKGETK